MMRDCGRLKQWPLSAFVGGLRQGKAIVEELRQSYIFLDISALFVNLCGACSFDKKNCMVDCVTTIAFYRKTHLRIGCINHRIC